MRYVLPVSVIALAAMALATPSFAQTSDHDKAHATGASHGHGTAKKDHHDPTIKKQDFGTTTVAGVKFKSITQEGQKAPKAIRAWIGTESAEGSAKTKADKGDKGGYHSHVDVPGKIPAGSLYWLEVEPEGGKKEKAGFKFFTEE
jgi:hypothetical protein